MALRTNRSGMRLPMRVWDAPFRLFHWALAILVVAAFVSAWRGAAGAHLVCGYAVLALLLFRLVWGIVGSDTARFARFLTGPVAALRSLGRVGAVGPDNQVGHDPAGGWMALLLLLLLAAQTLTGIAARRGGTPPQHPIAPAVGLAAWHDGLLPTAILVVLCIHLLVVAALAGSGRRDLIRPLLTGKKALPAATRAPRMAPAGLGWALLALSAVAAWLIATRA